jgi:hypothetical protein|tara:strand:- start:6452 stop:6844 length:393 start_codon:yes stop_codon:yes gene_type:complete
MLLFNWKKIYEETEGSTSEILNVLEMLHYKKIPYNRYDSLYKYRNTSFSGDSFLANPGILLEHSFRYTPKEIAIYVALASRRKLADYIAFNRRTLSSRHAPNLTEIINTNRLLYIEDGSIHFIYEEAQRR